MHDELIASRLAALETIEDDARRTSSSPRSRPWRGCSRSTACGSSWVPLLDVTEELDIEALPDDHPEIEGFVLYGYLSLLLDELVSALNARSRRSLEARWRRRGRLLDSSCPSASFVHEPPSSSGLGHHPFKVAARVRIPLGVPHAITVEVPWCSWSARRPVKPEAAGSSPVGTATRPSEIARTGTVG